MTNVVEVSLENEMDLVLAHKKSMKTAEKLGLTTATQTTFATAVSEIARTVIEHTDKGTLYIGLEQNKLRYTLVAVIDYDKNIIFTNDDAGFYYAQKLVPEFLLTGLDDRNMISMKIGLPRSLRLDPLKISQLKKYFEEEEPINAYDEIKQRNISLNKIALEKEEELRRSRIIDEQKTEFISVASHEIKTPITIIKAYSQMARSMHDECSDLVKDILGKVDIQTTKLMSLVQQLLDVSRLENGNLQFIKERVELRAFILDMVDIIKQIFPDHHFTTDLPDDLPVFIDKIRMEQVFSNLIGNAAKYSAKESSIEIVCSGGENGFVTIAVTDQGIGISPASLESIFNKFYRDKDVITTHSGLGMGLYVASKIIVGHGGRIWAESQENAGSTFYFTIPLTSEADS